MSAPNSLPPAKQSSDVHSDTAPEDAAHFQPSVRPSAKRRTLAIAVASVISGGLCLLALGYHRPKPADASTPEGISVAGNAVILASGAPQWQAVKLAPVKASQEQWSDPVPASVKVDETKAARVGSPLSGRVLRVFTELGEPVRAGQSLFSVASPDLAELTDAEAQTRVELETAKLQHERIQALIEAKALPGKEGIVSQAELRSAEIRHNLTVSKLSALKVGSNSEAEFVVKAPRAGTVVAKNVLPGQEVGAAAEANLITLADLSTVWVVAELFESNMIGIHRGTKVRITVASDADLLLEGQVDIVSEVVDPERHTVPVRVRFENRERRLRPNTFARMQFLSAAVPGTVEVAATALVTDGEQQSVYVEERPSVLTRRAVVAGPVRQGRVLILSGLKVGETVVETGAILLDNQVSLAQ
jgi:membrane fusion protein, heavy metal efflux system